jgi:hypothetical protein
MKELFRVAEISKNWPEIHVPDMPRTLSERFEAVMLRNHESGYRLHSWKLNRVVMPVPVKGDEIVINETIIAVFVLRELET